MTNPSDPNSFVQWRRNTVSMLPNDWLANPGDLNSYPNYDPNNPVTHTPWIQPFGNHAIMAWTGGDDCRIMLSGLVAGEGNFIPMIFKPSYLFNADDTERTTAQRPSICSVCPRDIACGTGWTIDSDFHIRFSNNTGAFSPTNGSSVVLIRPGSVTHSTGPEQRLVRLHFRLLQPGEPHYDPTYPTLKVTPPYDSHIGPPGDYMLFLVDANGIPSEARWVRVNNGPPIGMCEEPAGSACLIHAAPVITPDG